MPSARSLMGTCVSHYHNTLGSSQRKGEWRNRKREREGEREGGMKGHREKDKEGERESWRKKDKERGWLKSVVKRRKDCIGREKKRETGK